MDVDVCAIVVPGIGADRVRQESCKETIKVKEEKQHPVHQISNGLPFGEILVEDTGCKIR